MQLRVPRARKHHQPHSLCGRSTLPTPRRCRLWQLPRRRSLRLQADDASTARSQHPSRVRLPPRPQEAYESLCDLGQSRQFSCRVSRARKSCEPPYTSCPIRGDLESQTRSHPRRGLSGLLCLRQFRTPTALVSLRPAISAAFAKGGLAPGDIVRVHRYHSRQPNRQCGKARLPAAPCSAARPTCILWKDEGQRTFLSSLHPRFRVCGRSSPLPRIFRPQNTNPFPCARCFSQEKRSSGQSAPVDLSLLSRVPGIAVGLARHVRRATLHRSNPRAGNLPAKRSCPHGDANSKAEPTAIARPALLCALPRRVECLYRVSLPTLRRDPAFSLAFRWDHRIFPAAAEQVGPGR